MTTYHIFMSIKSAESMADGALQDMFNLPAAEVRESLARMKASGMEVIPSARCDNRDAGGYCQGHNDTQGDV